jgi:hypothetical protein
MGVKVSDLTTESAPASTDILVIADPTTGLAKKITVSALKTYMDGLGGGGDVTAPVIVSAEATTASTVTIVFSESVTVTTAGWSFKKNGVAWAISSVSGSGNTWIFTMSTSGVSTDTLLRSYSSTTGATVDTSANELATFTDSAVTNSIPAGISSEAIDWDQLSNLVDSGSGTISSVSATTPAGATATKKLTKANGNYVEFTVGSTVANSETAVFVLTSSNDAYYVWDGSQDLDASVYHYLGDYKVIDGTASTSPTSLATAPVAGDVVRMEIGNTDDVIIKVNGVTKGTLTAALSGITNIYIKAVFAVNASGKALESCNGVGLVAI